MLFLANLTREPLPLMRSHPAATSKLSIAAHSIVPETGSANTALSVRLCLLFTLAIYDIMRFFAIII